MHEVRVFQRLTIAMGVVLASAVPASAISLQQYLINIGFLAMGESPSSFTCTGPSTGTASVISGGSTFTTSFDASPDTIDECVGTGGGNTGNTGNTGNALADAADTAVQQATQLGTKTLLDGMRRPIQQPAIAPSVTPLFFEFLKLERERQALVERAVELFAKMLEQDPANGFDPRELEAAEARVLEKERIIAVLSSRIEGTLEVQRSLTQSEIDGIKEEIAELKAEAIAANKEVERLEQQEAEAGGLLGNLSKADREEFERNGTRSKEIDARQDQILKTIEQRAPGKDGERVINFLQGTKEAHERKFSLSSADDTGVRVAVTSFGMTDKKSVATDAGRDRQSETLTVNLSEVFGQTVAFSQGVNGDLDAALLRAFDPKRFDVWTSVEGTGFSDNTGTGTDGNGFSAGVGASYAATDILTLGLIGRYRRVDSEGVAQAFTGDFVGIAALAALSLPHQIDVEGLVLYEHGFNDLRLGAANGSFTTDTVAVALRASTKFSVADDISLSPNVQFGHSWTHRESFTDSAGAVAPSSTITQGLAQIGVDASSFIPVDDGWIVGIVPAMGIAGLAEFNRHPGSNRAGVSVRGSLELAFDGQARLATSAGYTVLGGFRVWTLGLTGSIPF